MPMEIINFRDARPIYEQISDYYKQMILSGIMAPDEQMPSVRNLAVDLSTNPNTIQKAYAELIRDGFIYTVKGRGNFVAGGTGLIKQKQEELVEKLSEIRAEGESLGLDMDSLWEMASSKEHKKPLTGDETSGG